MKKQNYYKLLLKQKENGVSFKTELKRHSPLIILRIALITIVAYVSPEFGIGPLTNAIPLIAIGALVGAQLHEFAVISNNVERWEYTKEITNWEKVKEYANKNS